MIRFCDMEFDSAEYASLTRRELLNYFLPDHKNNILLVYENSNMIGYVGIITYDSFHNSINFDSAIRREYIVWGIDMWQNARKYFGYYREVNSACLLPVFDQEGQLFCFAYEDSAADREIRMLRELQNISGGLQFSDVYPEYKGVKIYEFNELAYFFAQYLENQGVIVEVFGVMWRDIFSGNKCQMPNYECLSIYAEGVNGKESDWKENIIRSVSVEFECIDRIYESNISSGIIKDANGDFSWFVEQLRHENEIVIIGTGIFSLNEMWVHSPPLGAQANFNRTEKHDTM